MTGGKASSRFWIETLGCPKNAVDSDKVGRRRCSPTGWRRPSAADDADLVVVNTCAFIEAARQESIDTILGAGGRLASPGARLVVTGCMAERYGDELADALPEADAVVGFAGEGVARRRCSSTARGASPRGVRDLLELPRAAPDARRGPTSRSPRAATAPARSARSRRSAASSGRGIPTRSRPRRASLVEGGVAEIVLVAQDLAWYGRDVGEPGVARAAAAPARAELGAAGLRACASSTSTRARCATRSSSTMLELPTVVPYFDLSLQHADRALLRAHEAMGERRPVPRR